MKTNKIRMQTEKSKPHGSLASSLGLIDIVGIGLSAIIGAGIFVSFGKRLANDESNGWELFLAIVICAVACYFLSLLYAELSAAIGTSGSAYTYILFSLGRWPAYITGWLLAIEFLLSACMVAATTTAYLKFLIPIPLAWSNSWWSGEEGALFNLPAALIFISCSLLLTQKIKQAALINRVLVFLKVGALLLLILVGLIFIHWPNLSLSNASIQWARVSGSFTAVFFAFIGFDAVASAFEEARSPGKTVPIGIIGSLLISALIYGAFVLVLWGLGSPEQINDSYAPSVVQFFHAMPSGVTWLEKPMYIIVLIALIATILSVTYCQTRIFYAMAQNGLLPGVFARVDPRTQTPIVNTIITGICGGIVAGIIPDVSEIWDFISLATLLIFVLITISVIVLRRTHPNLNRPFKVQSIGLVVILTLGFIGLLVMEVHPSVWVTLTIFLVVISAAYLLFDRSRRGYQE